MMLFAAAAVMVVAVVVACLQRPRPAGGKVAAALQAVRAGDASPRQRRVVAREAQRRGLHDVAEDLATQADMQAELDRWTQAQRSPLAGVSDRQWQAWVEANELDELRDDRTPLYGLRARELDDAGLEEPDDEAAEYAALVAVTQGLQRVVAARYAPVIGTQIEGVTATLSGLLAVARCAGLGGLATWVADEAERARFARTTQAYNRTTGIF